MIVDFHHHFTPRELVKEDPGDRLLLNYDENGAPSYTVHRLLFDLDEHIPMMDSAGIDVAVLSSAAGMAADPERSRICNDRAEEAERAYPGRFIGLAHVNPLGGKPAFSELGRCADELGFPGVAITSEQDGLYLDAPELEPFWTEAAQRGLYVFVHPALRLNRSRQFDAYDLARSVGREFSLIMATIRLIDSGVFDRHPGLIVQMSHLSGGIASMLGRIRGFEDKEFWGTAGNPRHGRKSRQPFDHYLANNMVFDCGGFFGSIDAVRTALIEIPAARIVFGTDYPQEIRSAEVSRRFVTRIAEFGAGGDRILKRNASILLQDRLSKAPLRR
jgi:predicted TIM-barrel fold metal-dependent hydrolase